VFRAAQETCRPELADALPELDPEERAEMQERALAFARCMRGAGITEFPDPQFHGGRLSIGGPDGAPLPFDLADPEVRAASEACSDEVGGFGPAEAPGGDRS